MNKFPGSLLDIEYYLPDQILTNEELQNHFPDWNVNQTEKRTGVKTRRISKIDETAYDLALIAVKKLIVKYPSIKDKIDAIIFCTQSPDYIMPSNAFLLQRELKLKKNMLIFDYNLACSGYVYGLLMASSFIKTGIVRNVLLVTADTYSKYIASSDRATRMLFGDGASASLIGYAEDFENESLIQSFDDFQCASDGDGWDKFFIKTGGSRFPTSENDVIEGMNKIKMNGLHVLNLVNDRVIKQIYELLEKNSLETKEIEQFFLHQASGLALDSLKNKLKVGPDKVFSNIANVGNTVSSSIPILIKDYFSQFNPPNGSRLLLCGFGVGYSWGSLIATK